VAVVFFVFFGKLAPGADFGAAPGPGARFDTVAGAAGFVFAGCSGVERIVLFPTCAGEKLLHVPNGTSCKWSLLRYDQEVWQRAKRLLYAIFVLRSTNFYDRDDNSDARLLW
jgi:hypothetical protein